MKKFCIKFLSLLLMCFLLTGCNEKNYKNIEELEGKNIGVSEGTTHVDLVSKFLNNFTLKIYQNNDELKEALYSGLIDAYIGDECVIRYEEKNDSNIKYLKTDDKIDIVYAFTKNEKGKKLQKEINEYINTVKSTKQYNNLISKWFDNETNEYNNQYKNLSNLNGILKIAITDNEKPFTYYENNELIGIDIEFIINFAKQKGYAIEFYVMEFNEIIEGVKNGDYDIAMGCITKSDEREEYLYLSDSLMESYTCFVIYNNSKNKVKSYDDLKQLNGKTIGIYNGTVYGTVAYNNIENCKLRYYDNIKDLFKALKQGKIDAIVYDEPLARNEIKNNDNFKIINEYLTYDNYGYILNKNNENSLTLREQLNEYLRKIKDNKYIEEIDNKYFVSNNKKEKINFDELPNINGMITVGISTDIAGPFAYYENKNLVGYDVELIYNFCKEYGYALNFVDDDFVNLFSKLNDNTYDLLAGCLTLNNERMMKYYTTDASYIGGVITVVNNK